MVLSSMRARFLGLFNLDLDLNYSASPIQTKVIPGFELATDKPFADGSA